MPIARFALAAATLLGLSTGAGFGWGLLGHRIITREAVERLPEELSRVMVAAAERLEERSLDPDTILRERDEEEGARHFIHVDAPGERSSDELPEEHVQALRRYGRDSLRRDGSLPWRIQEVLRDLEEAMRAGDRPGIERLAGFLSHYVADLHQPLHLTANHDGQESRNPGIHKAFESRLIERYLSWYRKAIRRHRAVVGEIEHPFELIRAAIREGYPLVEGILAADTAARSSLEREGRDYLEALQERAGPIAEKQMSAAASAIAAFWYTAWVRAGKPALDFR
jgi:hypothetical protein